MSGVDRVWLITKQGAYYRPNSRGYTTCFYAAGRYTLEEAEKITQPNGPDGPRDGMGYVRQDHVKRDPIDPATLAALPEVDALIAQALDAAAIELDERGQQEQVNYGLGRETQNFYRARDLIRARAAAIRKGGEG
jgi:hypothetical protein